MTHLLGRLLTFDKQIERYVPLLDVRHCSVHGSIVFSQYLDALFPQ